MPVLIVLFCLDEFVTDWGFQRRENLDAREGEPRASQVRHVRACEEDGSAASRISGDYCFCKYNLVALS